MFWIVIAWCAGVVRVFWVCRVGVLNALTSLLFFGLIVQAQNLMADLSSSGSAAEYVFWAGVFGFTFLLWAFPIHYGARRSIDQLTGQPNPLVGHDALVEWLPRVLGLLPFLALALGIRGAREAVAQAADALPAARETIAQSRWLYAADAATALAFLVFVWFRNTRIKALVRSFVATQWNGNVLHPLALFATAAIFALAYFLPIWTSVHFPRALLVPPLFGSLVLAASWLTRLADRTGFPFLATVALGLGLLTASNTDFNDLRHLPNVGGDQRLDMAKAVALWETANGCKDPSSCPRPIVVAIAGGASRAAFTAATFIGDLLDHVSVKAPTPGRQIFAISGVSGGSYGAAVIQAALLDAQRGGDGARPPCRSAQTTWFGYKAWAGGAFTWRQCLQALTSGDYLSSTIIGLAFRDFIAPPYQKVGLPALADRAALLEMTWERQYAATLEPARPFYEGGDRCIGGGDRGLCRRAAHPAAYIGPGMPAIWMPLLLLNGTSVATGRRIVSADLASARDGTPDGGSLYSQAFDLHEVMSDQCPVKPPPIFPMPTAVAPELAAKSRAGEPARTLDEGVCAQADAPVDGPDVRLSTAALTSARFPIISPAGIFKMDRTIYGDQVVDGGYFENSGLTTASEIAQALTNAGFRPAIVAISNDPVFDVPSESQLEACKARNKAPGFSAAWCKGLPRRPATTPLEPPADNTFLGRFFSLFARPFQTLVATGDGHSDEVIARLRATLPADSFFRLRIEVQPSFDFGDDPVDPSCKKMAGKRMEMTKVSMSWWLAAAVQEDLDVQRCSRRNQAELARLEKLLEPPAAGR